jgi:hypothetical protein
MKVAPLRGTPPSKTIPPYRTVVVFSVNPRRKFAIKYHFCSYRLSMMNNLLRYRLGCGAREQKDYVWGRSRLITQEPVLALELFYRGK